MSMHEQALADYKAGLKYREIAAKYGVSLSTVKSWKVRYKWSRTKSRKRRKQNGPGAPIGNRNAVGNRGGTGGPIGNKFAVTTGEYETIWFGCLTETEQALFSKIDTNHAAQLDEEIRLATIRERRMLERIQDLVNGLTETQRRVLQERQITKTAVPSSNDVTGETKTIVVATPNLVTKTIDETTFRKIDDILRLEDALTRVQDKKIRLLSLKHSLGYDAEVLALRKREIEAREF